jgi:hypothetical protein
MAATALTTPIIERALLARRSTLSRARRGLRVLRTWMARYWSWELEISPRRVARDLGLGHGAASDLGYALRSLEDRGFAKKVASHPARYLLAQSFLTAVGLYGCLERSECDSSTACSLIGTAACPFLEGYGGD